MNKSRSPRTAALRRRALSAVEVFVALTILSTGMTVSAQLVVRHHRLLVEQRQYRLALDELSNQIEQLSQLPLPELEDALQNLQPGELIQGHLPGAALQGQLRPADLGQELTLSITWPDRGEAAPLALSAWIYPETESSP